MRGFVLGKKGVLDRLRMMGRQLVHSIGEFLG